MKKLLQQVWEEPAAAAAVAVVLLQIVQFVLVNNHTANAIIGIVLIGLGHLGVRQVVSPTKANGYTDPEKLVGTIKP